VIVPKLKPSTVNGYGSILDKHLIPQFGDWQLQAIDAVRISAFEAKLLKDRISPKTARNVLVLLGRILERARRDGYLKISPMLDVEKTPLEKTKKGRALTADEVNKLLQVCDERLRLISMIALLSGLRRSELFALHWTDDAHQPRTFVDFDNDVIRVRKSLFWLHGKHQAKPQEGPAFVFTVPKTQKSVRDVPLSPMLKRKLKEYYMRASDKVGLVFQTANGTPLDPDNVCGRSNKKKLNAKPKPPKPLKRNEVRLPAPASTFSVAVKRANTGPVRFHDLRHSYGSHKLDQGANIYDVQRWMGHSSIQVTIDIYGHPVSDRGQEEAVKTDTFLFGPQSKAE
jgi:integrase